MLKPRVAKDRLLLAEWLDGKPTAPETGISHAFKVLKIEGYEDALNNLDLKRSDAQTSLLDGFQRGKARRLPDALHAGCRGEGIAAVCFRTSANPSITRSRSPLTAPVPGRSAPRRSGRDLQLPDCLTVRLIDIQPKQGFVTVEGWLPTGEKTLILWRDCEKIGYEELTRLCDKLAINPADKRI